MLAGGGPVAIADHQLVVVLHVGDHVVHRRMAGLGHVKRGVGALDRIVVRIRGVLLPTAVEADGQLAFRVVLAEENFGDSGAAFLAGILGVEQRGNLVEPAPDIHAAAAGQGDDGVRIGRGNGFDRAHPAPRAA